MHAARSMAEAFLYLELDPCECAEVEADWDVASVSTLDEGGMSIKFDGTCRGCGRVRTSYFTVPDQATQLPPDRFAGPDDGPSTLFDPAEWWAIGTQYGEAADRRLADVVTEPDPGEQRAREQPAGEQAAGEHPAGGLRPGEQPGWHDHQAWSELTGLLARSAAAVDEMLRFLPDDATELPRDAFYTPWGRELRDREPERFARGTLATEATVRRQKLDSFVAAHPEPLQETDEVAVELARLPLARSNDEAQLYLALHSCECGETEFPPNVEQSEEADGILVLRYTGRCISCGQARAFAFRQRDDPSVQTGGGWAAVPEPSQLIDAGEWLWLADTLLGEYPADTSELDESDRDDLRDDLATSAAALDEVLKFLPPGAGTVPDEAFWSARGQAVREADPGRFDRDRLAARREGYLAAHATLAG